MRRTVIVTVLVVIAILAIVGGVSYWLWDNYRFYQTDDAQVAGNILSVSSPQAGQLNTLSAQLGEKVTAGQILGTVTTTTAAGGKATVTLSSPITGTIVQDTAVQGQNVVPGLPLVQIADLAHLTIMANIDEGRINDIKLGQDVDVHVDAFGGSNYKGHVQTIVAATAASFSLLPTTDNTSGNFSKVGQRIPVIISLDNTGGDSIVPGMSAEVTLHIH